MAKVAPLGAEAIVVADTPWDPRRGALGLRTIASQRRFRRELWSKRAPVRFTTARKTAARATTARYRPQWLRGKDQRALLAADKAVAER